MSNTDSTPPETSPPAQAVTRVEHKRPTDVRDLVQNWGLAEFPGSALAQAARDVGRKTVRFLPWHSVVRVRGERDWDTKSVWFFQPGNCKDPNHIMVRQLDSHPRHAGVKVHVSRVDAFVPAALGFDPYAWKKSDIDPMLESWWSMISVHDMEESVFRTSCDERTCKLCPHVIARTLQVPVPLFIVNFVTEKAKRGPARSAQEARQQVLLYAFSMMGSLLAGMAGPEGQVIDEETGFPNWYVRPCEHVVDVETKTPVVPRLLFSDTEPKELEAAMMGVVARVSQQMEALASGIPKRNE